MLRRGINTASKSGMHERFEQLKKMLAQRVGPMLPDVPEEQFEEIVEEMARLQYKYEAVRRTDDPHRIPPTSSDSGED